MSEFGAVHAATKVVAMDGKGNGLVAVRDIKKNDFLFKELPFVWASTTGATVSSSSCIECGRFCVIGTPGTDCICGSHYCSSACDGRSKRCCYSI